jgi:cytochrome c553
MKRAILIAGLFAVLGIVGNAQAAGDAQAGKAKSATCAGCHGAKGEGMAPNPALAGKSESQLLQAMRDYKSGKRDNAIMKGLVAALSDQDMENLTAYYASLKGK